MKSQRVERRHWVASRSRVHYRCRIFLTHFRNTTSAVIFPPPCILIHHPSLHLILPSYLLLPLHPMLLSPHCYDSLRALVFLLFFLKRCSIEIVFEFIIWSSKSPSITHDVFSKSLQFDNFQISTRSQPTLRWMLTRNAINYTWSRPASF